MRKALVFAVAVLLAAGLTGPTPAHAEGVGVLVLQGGGTTSGIDVLPNSETWDMDSTVSFVGVADGSFVSGAVSECHMGAASTVPSGLAAGAGDGVWACTSGYFNGASGTLTYLRVGIFAGLVLQGDGYTIVFDCIMQPGSFSLPITSYGMSCIGKLAQA